MSTMAPPAQQPSPAGGDRAVRRVALRDGQPPAYVFTSPCCGMPALVQAWMAAYARAHHGGQLVIACGRHTTDPLRTVGAEAGKGCGKRYTVQIEPEGGEQP